MQSVTGKQPELSTSGGTSDARFIKDAARVVEFGLVGKTMHKVDERVRLDDIGNLPRFIRACWTPIFPETYFLSLFQVRQASRRDNPPT